MGDQTLHRPLVTFTEIYHYDGPTATSTPGADVSAAVGANSITVTDEALPTGEAFYRLEAEKL